MNGQLRRAEQLSGRAGVGRPVPHVGGPFPQPRSPNPGKAEHAPSHPSRWVGPVRGALGGGQRMPWAGALCCGTPPVRLECSATRIPSVPRLALSPSRPAQGALGYPHRAPRGRGHAPGWGWGPGLCPLSLSPEPPAETRPHQQARQPARGRLPPPGSFSKSRPDLPVVRAVTEVVLWGRGLPAANRPASI